MPALRVLMPLLAVLTACSAKPQALPQPEGAAIEILASDAGKTIAVPVGQTFSVKLESVPTAGYLWRLRGSVPAFLEAVGEDTLPTSPQQLKPGFTGGSHWLVFRYRAVQPGAAELVFLEGRPWETQDPPSDTFRFTITARAQKP